MPAGLLTLSTHCGAAQPVTFTGCVSGLSSPSRNFVFVFVFVSVFVFIFGSVSVFFFVFVLDFVFVF